MLHFGSGHTRLIPGGAAIAFASLLMTLARVLRSTARSSRSAQRTIDVNQLRMFELQCVAARIRVDSGSGE
jgi:hypothetical protein